MKSYKVLFIIGFIVLVFPFLGIPEFFRNLIIGLAGAFLIGFSIEQRKKYKAQHPSEHDYVYQESHVEHPLEQATFEDVIEEKNE